MISQKVGLIHENSEFQTKSGNFSRKDLGFGIKIWIH
jgi:hypothetical protein